MYVNRSLRVVSRYWSRCVAIFSDGITARSYLFLGMHPSTRREIRDQFMKLDLANVQLSSDVNVTPIWSQRLDRDLNRPVTLILEDDYRFNVQFSSTKSLQK